MAPRSLRAREHCPAPAFSAASSGPREWSVDRGRRSGENETIQEQNGKVVIPNLVPGAALINTSTSYLPTIQIFSSHQSRSFAIYLLQLLYSFRVPHSFLRLATITQST